MDEKTIARFWSKVDKNGPTPQHMPEIGPCWAWIGKRRKDGRGIMVVEGRETRTHRLSYELATGETLGYRGVFHHCDNPSCVRPTHLFAGEQIENVHDMWRKGRGFTPPARRGPDNNKTKLRAEDVLEIRRRYAAGETQPALAREFGVKQTTVSNVVLNRMWRHLPGAAPIRRPRNVTSTSGVRNFNSKLNPDKVTEIRAQFAAGRKQSAIAREFGVGTTAVKQIVTRVTWRDVP